MSAVRCFTEGWTRPGAPSLGIIRVSDKHIEIILFSAPQLPIPPITLQHPNTIQSKLASNSGALFPNPLRGKLPCLRGTPQIMYRVVPLNTAILGIGEKLAVFRNGRIGREYNLKKPYLGLEMGSRIGRDDCIVYISSVQVYKLVQVISVL